MGAFIAKQGYYLGVSETAKAFMQPFEWDYWYEGKPAADTINDPYGNPMEKAGHVPRRRLVLQPLRQHGVLEHADGQPAVPAQEVDGAADGLKGLITEGGAGIQAPPRPFTRLDSVSR